MCGFTSFAWSWAMKSLLAIVPAIDLHRFVSILLTLLLFSIAAQGQTYMFGRADFPVGNYPIAVVPGDFNGDGITDFAVVNSADNTVSVLLGRTDGTLAPQLSYPTGPEPVAIVAADFNGDGILDLAIANANCTGGSSGPNCSPSTVSILLGNGDGTFQPHFDLAVGTLPSSVVAADFNKDGTVDLAVANASDGTVSVLLGNGDGTFQPQVLYATQVVQPTFGQSNWESAVVGDFNGDGKPDLAVSCDTGCESVSVLLGNGDGTFGPQIDTSVGGLSLAAGDFNQDGKLDLAVTASPASGGTLSVLLGNGDGTFILQAQYTGGDSVAAADVNGDGKIDLLLSSYIGTRGDAVAVLLGNGDGTFQPAALYGTGSSPFGFAVTDVNGDGKLDVVTANSGCFVLSDPCTGQQIPSGTISVLLGFGDGTFVGKADYAAGDSPDAVTSADFNKDGKLDLAAANQSSDSVAVLLGKGDGTFQAQVSFPVGHYPVSLAVGDFRNNGDLDLVTANEACFSPPCTPGTVSVLLGNGDGTFQPHADYGAGLQPVSVAVGDLRSNGNFDLAVTNFGSSSVSILLGNGDGTFQPQVSYPTAIYPGQIAIADFNQDGKPDLAIAADGSISILLGNGDGTFKSHVDYPGGGTILAIADFNGDGKLDIAAEGEGAGTQVAILLGNGDGTFQAPVNYTIISTSGLSPDAVLATDFNNDGKLDLAVSVDGNESFILLGNGDGTFQQPIEYLMANEDSSSLTVGDFNGDGVPDWAAADAGTATIGVMLSTAFKAVSPGSLNFGSQGVGTTSQPQTITLSNPSNVKISIASIASNGNFSATNNCGADLSPGANCQVSVTFSPTTTGSLSGNITVTDSTRISPLAIPLSGTGVNGPFLTPSPSQETFPPQAVGVSSSPAAIIIENTGSASLNMTGISITGTNSSDFTQTNNCGGSLAPAGSCIVNVTFTPTAGASRIASLSVSDNAPGNPQTVGLTGIGIGPFAGLSSNALTFPSQTVGTTSTAQTVTLTNTGNTALNITNISTSGDFSETNTCASVTPAGSCQISVFFTPTAAGNLAGSVTITDNAQGGSQAINLSGIGAAAPDFAIAAGSGSPTSQTIDAGQSAPFNLVITPSATFTGTVTLSCSVTPVVSPAPTCALSTYSVQLSGGTSQPVALTVGTTAATTTTVEPFILLLPRRTWIWILMLPAAVYLLARRRKRLPAFGAPLLALSLSLCMSCGSSSHHTTGGTPAGTYTATVKGTSGSLTHTMALQVVVQ
jgi:hypothetical protein